MNLVEQQKTNKEGENMNRISLKSAIVLVLGGMVVASQTPTHAQFGGLLGGGKKSSADKGGAVISKEDFGKTSGEVTGKVLAARIAFLDSKAKMMEALGIKTDSMAKASEALQAVKGNADAGKTVEALKDSSKVSEEANKEFEAKMAESKDLSAESKAKFAEGGAKFVDGVLLEHAQIGTIKKLADQGQALVKSSGLMEKMGVMALVKPVTTLVTMVPGDVREGAETLSKIMKFAKSQNVEILGADKVQAKLGAL